MTRTVKSPWTNVNINIKPSKKKSSTKVLQTDDKFTENIKSPWIKKEETLSQSTQSLTSITKIVDNKIITYIHGPVGPMGPQGRKGEKGDKGSLASPHSGLIIS